MTCYHPLTAYQCTDGGVTFVERARYDIVRELQLPCGQCIGCRLERSRQWAMRCVHEASLHEKNSFVTLTYDGQHLPKQLEYGHFQKFLKRVRRHFEPDHIRFYMCGEYGEQLQRPHFHAILFNCDWPDKQYWSQSEHGGKNYRSKLLEELWGKGHCLTSEANFATAAYTARYCMKKTTGHNAQFVYQGKTPEFNRMSLKPGIGEQFLEKWKDDIYTRDYVIINGKETKPPKYYDKLLKNKETEKYEEIKYKRETEGRKKYEDNTEERLKVKEIVTEARIRNLKRNQQPQNTAEIITDRLTTAPQNTAEIITDHLTNLKYSLAK